MIHLITGKPRSGKSYLAVKTLSEFFTYDKDSDYWFPKKEFKSLKLITNIEGLLLPHESLSELCEKMKLSVPAFFTKPVQEKISLKHPFIVYVLDEAQQFFPDNFRGNDSRFYFEYHGHLGHTIYLLTQDKYRIWRGLSSLAEFETRAVKKSLSLFGEIKYNEISSGEIVGRKVLKPSQQIYDLYQSEKIRQPFAKKIPIKKFVLVPLILTILSGAWMIKQFSGWISPTKKDSGELLSSDNDSKYLKPHPSNKTGVATFNPYPQKLRVTMDSIKINGIVSKILHPITGELVSIADMPYEIHFNGRDVYAYMTPDQFTQYILTKKEQETESGGFGTHGAAPVGRLSAGPDWAGGS